MITAMITTTTRISTRVKPLLRMAAPGTGDSVRVERRGADIRVVAFSTGFAVASVGDDVVVSSIGAGADVHIGVVPRVLRQRGQIASRPIIGEGRVHRLRHQRLQSLLGRGILKVIKTIQIQSGLDGGPGREPSATNRSSPTVGSRPVVLVSFDHTGAGRDLGPGSVGSWRQ